MVLGGGGGAGGQRGSVVSKELEAGKCIIQREVCVEEGEKLQSLASTRSGGERTEARSLLALAGSQDREAMGFL